MDIKNNIIESSGFFFIHNFDSGNLGHVERVPTELIVGSLNNKTNVTETPDYEFNLWTRPDCAGTEFENGNRTWFYFGIQAGEPGVVVRLNLINLNKQGKMYNQGMAPVTRTLPGKPQWERIRDRPVHSTDDNTFTLSFKYRTSENLKATTFFAFTYPFSFAELQIALNSIDLKMLPLPPPQSPDDIYYHRECLVYSLEGRRVDLLTITSHHGMTNDREERLKNLFPENHERPFKFINKKVVFISARVHPGETPSSFVFNGFLNLILTRNDPIAVQLRKLYVFKMIPFLNPDGVARGHYRTDTRGVNLNRVYLNPSLIYHPTVYASRALIRYYHYGCEKEDNCEDLKSITSKSIQNISESAEFIDKKKKGCTSTSTISAIKNDKRCKPVNKPGLKPPGIKQESTIKYTDRNKPLITESNSFADQVYDIKLQEMMSQTSANSSKMSVCNTEREENKSLLNETILESCLGSNVHLSTSEELNIQGSNPLRPLRDTLKNSISLLMDSSTTGDGSVGGKESRNANVKMGWCKMCRDAIRKLEDSMPGVADMLPGYQDRPTSIDEYRDVQRQKVDEQEKRSEILNKSSERNENVFFCTNCFKRYLINDSFDEIKVLVSQSYASVSVGCELPPARGTGDAQLMPVPDAPGSQTTVVEEPAVKEEKSKAASRARKKPAPPPPRARERDPDSGLYLYIDLHGHASKKGIFMYGNHFEDVESCVECMLLPRIMSLNNLHFHFSSCNFTERNMYLKDRRDGMSREGSGRVAVLKATGLVRSYTLECNYNTGRLVNVLPAPRDAPALAPAPAPAPPPKYTPHIFEEVNPFQMLKQRQRRAKILDIFGDINPKQVGRSLGASILDLTGQHPNSRIPCSEHRSLPAVREWLRAHTRTCRPMLTMSRLRPKTASPTRLPLYARSKGKVTDERKENTYAGASESQRASPARPRSGADLLAASMKFAKKEQPTKSASRTRYLAEPEPKPKTLTTKRRNVLGVRKSNASKTSVSRKGGRRSDDSGSLTRATRPPRVCRALASSSSSEAWEPSAAQARRRPFPTPSPSRLKKIRLKPCL